MGNRKGSTLDISVNIILEADKELYNYEEQYFGTDELEPFFNVMYILNTLGQPP